MLGVGQPDRHGAQFGEARATCAPRDEPLPDGPQDRETLQAAMAIQGYIAFNEVLGRAQRKTPVDTDLILDLYEALFRPSVDAGITDSAMAINIELVRY